MKLFPIVFTFLLTVSSYAITPNKDLMLDMSRTYGYYLGQNYALDNIEKKYPSLKNEIFLVKNEFDLKYLKSIKEIEQFYIKNMSKKQWNDFKSTISNGIKKQLNTNISYEEALESIKTGKARIKGEIESPVIETLLMFNPAYQKNPILELSDNFYQNFNTKNHSKAKGVDFSVRVPKSWKSSEGNRPNIIRKFASNNGFIVDDFFSEYIMFLVFDLPMEVNSLTQQDVNEFCTELPENTILRECKKTNLENLPVITQRFKMNMSRLDANMTIELIQYNIFFKNKIIMIQGHVGTMNQKVSEKVLLERFEKFKPVFNYVANSLVINDLYVK